MEQTTPLQEKFNELPRNLNFEKRILPVLEKNGITKGTFYRDLKVKATSIPHERLQVYAGLFDCEVADLIDSYVKVKPLVKRKPIGHKVGLKN